MCSHPVPPLASVMMDAGSTRELAVRCLPMHCRPSAHCSVWAENQPQFCPLEDRIFFRIFSPFVCAAHLHSRRLMPRSFLPSEENQP